MLRYPLQIFQPKELLIGDLSFKLVDDLKEYSGFINSNEVSRLTTKGYLERSKSINGFACYLVVLDGDNFLGALPLHRVNLLRFSTGYTGMILSNASSPKKTEDFLIAIWKYFSRYSFLSFLVMEGFSSPKISIKKLHNIYIAGASLQFVDFIPVRFLDVESITTEEQVLKQIPSKSRSQIKNARTDDIDLQFVYLSHLTVSELTEFLMTYVRFLNKCRKETGVSPIIFDDLLNEIQGCLSSNVELLVSKASLENQTLGMCLFHSYGDVSLYVQGGSLSETRSGSAYSFLFFKTVSELAKSSKYIELGRVDRVTEKLTRIDKFKSNFSNEIFFGCRISYEPRLYRAARMAWDLLKSFKRK